MQASVNELMSLMRSSDAATVAEAAELLDHPTGGTFAEALWRLSNAWDMRYTTADALMRQCGYSSFCGYPLSRNGKLPTQLSTDRAYHNVRWEANPIIRILLGR